MLQRAVLPHHLEVNKQQHSGTAACPAPPNSAANALPHPVDSVALYGAAAA